MIQSEPNSFRSFLWPYSALVAEPLLFHHGGRFGEILLPLFPRFPRRLQDIGEVEQEPNVLATIKHQELIFQT